MSDGLKYSVFTASTPDWTPEEALAEISGAGYQGIEWRVVDQAPSDGTGFWMGNRATIPFTGILEAAPRIAEQTREAGLSISGVGGYQLASNREGAATMLEATAAMGAPQVRLTMQWLGSSRELDERTDGREMVSAARADLAWAVERAKDLGVKVLVEMHHRTIAASASGALRLVEGLDPEHIGVIHDSGNMVVEGQEDYLFGFQILGEYLAHVHLKNSRWVAGEEEPAAGLEGVAAQRWRPEQTPMWRGIADLDAYLAGLARVGYTGWITMEDFSETEPLADRIKHNLAYIRGLAAKHYGD
ncbi:sugar phosphate isomerase/epimerase family protein [Haematomicrobium sanguinis]|uniref:sugar phosphate isomerase/epimerase family protein n=1 Tax=Haematomicrobium sanguinis TaxID=479106 RepID=UPI000AFCBB24|nr:sugar phosphate isomerase/epimerase family protein [Haematomicrobium sanguinis]